MVSLGRARLSLVLEVFGRKGTMQIESMLFMTALVFLKVLGMSAQRFPTWGLRRHAQEALPQVATRSISSCDKQSRILQLLRERERYLCCIKGWPKVATSALVNAPWPVVFLLCWWNVSSGDIREWRIKFKLFNWNSVSSVTLPVGSFFLLTYKITLLWWNSSSQYWKRNFTLPH